MLQNQDASAKYYAVWQVVSWIAVNSCTSPEYREEFDLICRYSTFPFETRLEYGLEIIKSAIFHRGMGGTQHSCRKYR